MICRQERHSPSRLTWVMRPQRRQERWPGKARRHLAHAAQLVLCLLSPQPRQIGHCPTGQFLACDIDQLGGRDRRGSPRRGVGRTEPLAWSPPTARRVWSSPPTSARGSASSKSATVQPSAAHILSRSSSRTEIGLPLHSAATLLSDGVNPTSSKAFSRSLGRQTSRLAAAHRRFHFTADSPRPSSDVAPPARRPPGWPSPGRRGRWPGTKPWSWADHGPVVSAPPTATSPARSCASPCLSVLDLEKCLVVGGFGRSAT